ncbi:hypothetical protein A9Q81_00355 [Gammaproteobacteria bacterium 42_54_T18]|nr:hypothetical protein A9Q81_00355 [Gammaproteobacteria bacterium 42_54_T18]
MKQAITELSKMLTSISKLYSDMEYSILSVEDENYTVLIKLNEVTKNHVNSIHAAYQFAAAESIGGVIGFLNRPSMEYNPVVKSVSINYKKPALSDITASTRFTSQDRQNMLDDLKNNNRHNFTSNIIISNENGETVAEVHAEYVIGVF